ncbi:hypothetical protein HK102_002324, partial [Quaeritorhiza haematococci]
GGAESTLGGSTKGYHVLKVIDNSPAEIAGLEPFFDYILAINNIRLDDDTPILVNQLTANVGKNVSLLVYSTKRENVREVVVVPSNIWGKPEEGLLGCSVRFCDWEGAAEHVWHVLEVHPDSPAATAGLRPQEDYIIGTPHRTLRSNDEFYELVEDQLGSPLQLYVYNYEFDTVREVMIVPNREWGGAGSLGCDVGYGYLHRIPARNAEGGTQQLVSARNIQEGSYSENRQLNATAYEQSADELQMTSMDHSSTGDLLEHDQVVPPPHASKSSQSGVRSSMERRQNADPSVASSPPDNNHAHTNPAVHPETQNTVRQVDPAPTAPPTTNPHNPETVQPPTVPSTTPSTASTRPINIAATIPPPSQPSSFVPTSAPPTSGFVPSTTLPRSSTAEEINNLSARLAQMAKPVGGNGARPQQPQQQEQQQAHSMVPQQGVSVS